jgi:hypothetical protein
MAKKESISDNVVTEKKFIKVVFDPYEESTLTYSKDELGFYYSGHGTHAAKVHLTIRRYEDEDEDLLGFYFISEASASSGYPSWDVVTMDNIAFSCDEEIVSPIKTESGESDHGIQGDGSSQVYWKKGTAVSFIEVEDFKKICDAESIQIRYFGGEGRYDLPNESEEEIQLACRRFYHESYDDSAYIEHVNVERDRRTAAAHDRLRAAWRTAELAKPFTVGQKISRILLTFVGFLFAWVIIGGACTPCRGGGEWIGGIIVAVAVYRLTTAGFNRF